MRDSIRFYLVTSLSIIILKKKILPGC